MAMTFGNTNGDQGFFQKDMKRQPTPVNTPAWADPNAGGDAPVIAPSSPFGGGRTETGPVWGQGAPAPEMSRRMPDGRPFNDFPMDLPKIDPRGGGYTDGTPFPPGTIPFFPGRGNGGLPPGLANRPGQMPPGLFGRMGQAAAGGLGAAMPPDAIDVAPEGAPGPDVGMMPESPSIEDQFIERELMRNAGGMGPAMGGGVGMSQMESQRAPKLGKGSVIGRLAGMLPRSVGGKKRR